METTISIKEKTLNELINNAIVKNWDKLALSDIDGINYRYRDVAELIEKLHILFENAGLKPGDKIALCGKNSATWCVILLACLTGGYVCVPILHEFKPETVEFIINHSESKLLFVDEAIWHHINADNVKGLEGAIYISEFGMPLSRNEKLTTTRNELNELFGKRFPYKFDKDDCKVKPESLDDLAIISYTSGSTGMSKGVMLPYRSLWNNVRFCLDNLVYLKAGDGIVNMLPLAHLYGMVIEMLHPFCRGCHCNFLLKVPSPKILLKAFAQVRPKLIITVPLVLEKIIRTRIFPMLQKPLMKLMLRVPFLDDKLLSKVREGLIDAFGGEVREIIIGGAALNKEVDAFLNRIGFPYTVGYGMTECGPLLTYATPEDNRPGGVGRFVCNMYGRIDSPDPANIPGNLWVKGDNVMQGYYKNPEATAEVFDKEGWMNTGDMCRISDDGLLSICGRSKTMILGPSGQNIYPEEIEQKLNNLPFVAESLIVDEDGKLVALIYPDYEAANIEGYDAEALEKVMDANIITLNKAVENYSKVSSYRIMDKEFEKTPKRSIKRYLYQSH